MFSAKQVYKFSQSLRVLYVEDDENLRAEVSILLETFFEHIDTAMDGADGLDKYNHNEYDIVITDINMPKMGGIEMVSKIHEIYPEQKIIAVSAHNESHLLINLIEKGVSSFILKPIKEENFFNILYPICRDAHAQRDNIQLYEALNEERSKLTAKIRSLEAQVNATSVKHQQVEQLLQEKSDGHPQPHTGGYFDKDEDEGTENVVFMKEDSDELREIFNELPDLMMQYTLTHDIENFHQVVGYLKKVSSILLIYSPFLDTLSSSFEGLASAVDKNIEKFAKMFETNSAGMFRIWDAINIDIERYLERFSVESMAMKNIHHIHHPTSLSIQQIIILIDEDIEPDGAAEIEFF